MPIAPWEKLTEWLLAAAAAAVLLLVAYAPPIIWPGEASSLTAACRAVVWTIWAVFPADFGMRLVLAERDRHVLRHWLDVLIIALPLLRPPRLLRLVTLLKVLNRRATPDCAAASPSTSSAALHCSRSAARSPSSASSGTAETSPPSATPCDEPLRP